MTAHGSDFDGTGHEEQFRLLVDEVEEYAIFMLDPDGYVTTWNEGAEKIKGYRRDDILGTHFSVFYPDDDVEAGRPEKALAAAAREGQWIDEDWRVRKDGSRFWARVTITALRDEEGRLRGFGKVTRDMTDRRKREVELERQKRRAERAERRARRENALLRLMQTVAATANDADSLDDAMQETIEAVCEHTGWPVGHVYRSAEDGDLVPTELWTVRGDRQFEPLRAATKETRFSVGDGLPGRAALDGEPVWILDVTDASDFRRTELGGDLGVKGGLAFPVELGGETIAVLEFFSEAEAEPDEGLLDALGSVGTQLSRVAERERARDELRRRERRYRRLFETSQEGIVIQAADRTITDLNPAALDILGYEREELVGTKPRDLFVDPEHRRQLQRRIEEQGQLRNVELQLRRRDGAVIFCEATATLRQSSGNDPEALYTIFRDVTERKRAQKALEESEKKFRALAENAPVGIGWVQEGVYRYVNPAYARIVGYEREEIVGQSPEMLMHPEDWPRVQEQIRRRLDGEAQTVRYQARMQTKTGETRYVEVQGTQITYQGKPTLLGTVQDVTRRRRLQEELLQVQDEERQRLGQELHDAVGSLLTAAAIKTSTLAEGLRSGETVEPEDLDEATESIKEAADEARAISHGLSPVGLERGLSSALEELASQAEVRGEMEGAFEADGELPELAETTATHLYRIAQEAVSNAVQHADADRIRIRLSTNDGEALSLTVEDDGKGYSGAGGADEEGLGMRTMRYRAELLGGSLSVETGQEGGTLVRCRIPT